MAFGAVSVGLWLHCADGVVMRRDLRWTLGIGVLAVNFSVVGRGALAVDGARVAMVSA